MGDGLDDPGNYALDTTAEAALHEWARGRDATWWRSLYAKRHRGRSGAHLERVIIGGPDGRDAQELYVKVLPDRRSAEETARHQAALRADPEFAKRHLVRQPYPRHPVGDGRFLMFQDVAHGAERVVSLADVPDAQLTVAYPTLVERLLGWCRREQRTSRTTVSRFVRRELADAGAWQEILESTRALGLTEPDADWFRVADSDVALPNPLRLAEPGSPFGDDELDQRCGASHGDPHRDNVLYPATRQGAVRVDQFRLVDVARFAEDAPLTRDLVILLLDAVLPELAEGLGDVRAAALRALLIDPAEEASERLPLLLTKVIRSCYAVGTTYVSRSRWAGASWRAQYLLSLVSQALISCTYDNAGPRGRAWYLRLAAEAAEAYRREFRPEVAPPRPAPVPPVVGVRGDVHSRPADLDDGRLGPFEAAAGRSYPAARAAATDGAWPERPGFPGDPAPPVWTYGVVPIPEWQTSGSAHPGCQGAATGLRPPGERSTTPGLHGHVPAGGEPTVATAGRTVGARTAAPRHARTQARTPRGAAPPHPAGSPGEADGIPRPRRPLAAESVALRPARRRTHPPRSRLRMLVALVGGVSLVSLVTVGVVVLHGGDRSPIGLHLRPLTPPTESSPASVDASTQLADLALAVAGRPSPAAEGPYTSICLRVWSPPANLAPGVDPGTYRDEQLSWSRKLSGRRVVTPVVAGRRSTEPQVSRYREGELTEVPPEPSADPTELREQLTAQLDGLPPELRNAAGLMELVSRLQRYHLLGPGQRSALLHVLATTPGIAVRGSYPDWVDRPGLAFSADDGQGRRETLQFAPDSGELLSHQTTIVDGNLTLGYQLFLSRTRTDSSTAGRCR
ncbi:hypothetical protein [Micromonospora sp. NPDC023644]|uniref:hypothetical protein n=1 Tax=Micromonospora sp. NPDC023644 TaxID=3154321 RepID=UPI0033C4B574